MFYLIGPSPLCSIVLVTTSLNPFLLGTTCVIVVAVIGLIVGDVTNNLAFGGTGMMGVAKTFLGTIWVLDALVAGEYASKITIHLLGV